MSTLNGQVSEDTAATPFVARETSPCQRCGVVRKSRRETAYCFDCRPWAERDGWIEKPRQSWKLTAADKAAIRARAADGESRADLASEYGVTVHTIGRIVTGSW